jgi:hypothetical protein
MSDQLSQGRVNCVNEVRDAIRLTLDTYRGQLARRHNLDVWDLHHTVAIALASVLIDEMELLEDRELDTELRPEVVLRMQCLVRDALDMKNA